MAKKIYDEEITKQQDWGGDESTNNLPVAGSRVQEFIKNTFNKKIGTLYYDATNNRYLAFADTDTKDEYLADTTKTELVLGTFDAPFNYNASIKLISKQLVNIFKGTTDKTLFTSLPIEIDSNKYIYNYYRTNSINYFSNNYKYTFQVLTNEREEF